jgi:hypothetical protein
MREGIGFYVNEFRAAFNFVFGTDADTPDVFRRPTSISRYRSAARRSSTA